MTHKSRQGSNYSPFPPAPCREIDQASSVSQIIYVFGQLDAACSGREHSSSSGFSNVFASIGMSSASLVNTPCVLMVISTTVADEPSYHHKDTKAHLWARHRCGDQASRRAESCTSCHGSHRRRLHLFGTPSQCHYAPCVCAVPSNDTISLLRRQQVAVAALIFEVQRSARSEARKEEARRQELEVASFT